MLRSDLKIVCDLPNSITTIDNGTFVINNGTVEIGYLTDGFCVNTLVIENPSSACQSLYLVNLDLKQPSKDIRLTFPFTRVDALYVTSQSLIRRDGLLVKQETDWLTNANFYKLMYNARAVLSAEYSDMPEIPCLNKIEEGYLAKMLMLKHKIGSSRGLEALYGLEHAWKALDELDNIFQKGPVDRHMKLINLGLLRYYDVNTYLQNALIQGKWITLKSILIHYGSGSGSGSNTMVNYKEALALLVVNPETARKIPKELFDRLCANAETASRLKRYKYKPFNSSKPDRPYPT